VELLDLEEGVFTDMNRWMEIRRRVLVEGVSKRQVMAEEGIHWETLKKILANGNPPGYRQKRGRPHSQVTRTTHQSVQP